MMVQVIVRRLLLCGWLVFSACTACVSMAAPVPPTPEQLKKDIGAILDTGEFETETTVYRWQWRGAHDPSQPADDDAAGEAFMRRLAAFADWLARGLEALLWGLAIVALVLTYLRRDRWLHLFARSAVTTPYRSPTQISGLDIRPEQLPADVVAAARAAWERGDPVAALSLLYRAALSRLVHERQLDLPGSATEGDCVHIVAQRCGDAMAEYFGVLTRAWQFVAYAGRPPSSESADWLLDNFDRHFASQVAP